MEFLQLISFATKPYQWVQELLKRPEVQRFVFLDRTPIGQSSTTFVDARFDARALFNTVSADHAGGCAIDLPGRRQTSASLLASQRAWIG
jgi:hypothetical protein